MDDIILICASSSLQTEIVSNAKPLTKEKKKNGVKKNVHTLVWSWWIVEKSCHNLDSTML